MSDIIDKIVRKGHCTGCGGCVSLDDSLFFDMGRYEPVGKDSRDISLKICAGYDLPMSKLERFIFGKNYGGKHDKLLGNYLEFLLSRAIDKRVRENASSGGLISALLIYALENDVIDAAIVAGKDKKKPYLTVPVFATDRKEIIETAQTSYAMCPSLLLLKEAKQRGFERIGLVALPCVIETLRKIQMLKLDQKYGVDISFVIGSFCSGVSPYNYSTEVLITQFCGIKLENVKEIKYREGKYPGNFVVRTKDRKEARIPFHRMAWYSTGIKRDRCEVCLDRGAELADVSVGDTKLPQMDAEIHQTERYSGAIVRTEIGKKLVHQAKEAGYIEISELDPTILKGNIGLNRKADAQIKRKERKGHGVEVPKVY